MTDRIPAVVSEEVEKTQNPTSSQSPSKNFSQIVLNRFSVLVTLSFIKIVPKVENILLYLFFRSLIDERERFSFQNENKFFKMKINHSISLSMRYMVVIPISNLSATNLMLSSYLSKNNCTIFRL